MKFKVTENNYNKVLDSNVFSDADIGNVIKCTNELCRQPATPVRLDEESFMCIGKQKVTGIDCYRLFTVTKI